MFVLTGWTWHIWPSRNSGGNWHWPCRTKGKLTGIGLAGPKLNYVMDYPLDIVLHIVIVCCYINLFKFLLLNGLLLFKSAGWYGIPGSSRSSRPPWSGRTRPSCKLNRKWFVSLWWSWSVEKAHTGHLTWAFLGNLLYTLALFTGTSRTTRCSRGKRTPRRGASRTKGIFSTLSSDNSSKQ